MEKPHTNGDIKIRKSHVTIDVSCDNNSLLPVDSGKDSNGQAVQYNNNNDISKKGGPQAEEFTPPDGGWGWVVCFASFWVNGTIFGMLNTFGVLLPEISKLGGEQQNVTTKVSLIASITLFMTFFMSMISSIAADQLGIRKVAAVGGVLSFIGVFSSAFVQRIELLYLTYGMLLGVGSSFIYSGSLVILGHYFKKRMALVNGIVTTGSAIFTLGLPYLLKYLLDTKGLKFTLFIESILIATTILCALVFKPLIPKKSSKTNTDEISNRRTRSFLSTESVHAAYTEATDKVTSCFSFIKRYLNIDIWRNKGYLIWAIGITCALFGYFIPLVHINNYTKVEFPTKDGEILIMMIGGVSGVGRLISGKLGDMKCVNRVLFQQIAFIIYGVTTFTIPFITSFEVLVVLCVILGVMDGCFVCLLGPIAFDLVGAQNASQAMGCLLAMISIPIMMGPMIGGWVYDATSSYDYAFYYAGVPPLVGAVIMFFIPKISSRMDGGGTQAEAFASISHWSLYEPNHTGKNKSKGEGLNALSSTPEHVFPQEETNPEPRHLTDDCLVNGNRI
ncbi:monocarboxylate transporter 10-like [Watersipora subatra]|uniref:monocarboxylate transporter 10-like n=1 Tax=Watersipora subatra TaxID=2589382 RepID=UPI00355BA17E